MSTPENGRGPGARSIPDPRSITDPTTGTMIAPDDTARRALGVGTHGAIATPREHHEIIGLTTKHAAIPLDHPRAAFVALIDAFGGRALAREYVDALRIAARTQPLIGGE